MGISRHTNRLRNSLKAVGSQALKRQTFQFETYPVKLLREQNNGMYISSAAIAEIGHIPFRPPRIIVLMTKL